MICKLCGNTLSRESRELDYCRNCGAKHIYFSVKLEDGSVYEAWASQETKDIEAAIGRLVFEEEYQAAHVFNADDGWEIHAIIRIRALRNKLKKMSV